MDTDGDGAIDIAEYRAATSNPTMIKLFTLMDSQGEKDGSLSMSEWLNVMTKVGHSMTDEQFEADLVGLMKTTAVAEAAKALPPARLQRLKEVFKSMDLDEDGTVDISEYRAATSNDTMIKLFTHMDSSGDGNGELTLDEWLQIMSKVGQSMSDEQFESDLLGLIKPPPESAQALSANRLARLKQLFNEMDTDGDGTVECVNRIEHAPTLALLKPKCINRSSRADQGPTANAVRIPFLQSLGIS